MQGVCVGEFFTFRSEAVLNLHHVLYSEAWAQESADAGAALGAQVVADDLRLRSVQGYHMAVDYYRENLIAKDLLFDASMRLLSAHLVGRDGAAPQGWSEVFMPLTEPYLATDWPAHHQQNLAWTKGVTDELTLLLPAVIARLEELFHQPLPDPPILVSTVVAGRTGPAYTTVGPTHIICSTTHRKSQGHAAVEIVLHEACHALADPLLAALAERIDPKTPGAGDLWHVVLFYVVGEAVARAWAERAVSYQPYLDATGLLDRVWPSLRVPVRSAWSGYLDGTWDWDSACGRLAKSIQNQT